MHSLWLLLSVYILHWNGCDATVYYVNPHNSITTGGGKQWHQAFITLDQAMSIATKRIDEIWLLYNATYSPSTTDRAQCFETSIGLSIYGGFLGNETAKSQRDESLYDLYPSIISGNINDNKQHHDNCYHVITYQHQLTLDGVTIADGYADLQSYEDQSETLHKYGGGLITFDGASITNLRLNHVRFVNNYALNGGALWFMSDDLNNVQALITNCQFIGNRAMDGQYEGGYGGAVYLYFLSNVTVENTQFINNSAAFKAGAVYQDYGGIFSCDGCLFVNNTAGAYGGALFAEDRNSQTEGTFPVVRSSVFERNYADIFGGAICWFNDVIGTLENNTFDDNHAGLHDSVITLIGSEINSGYSEMNTFVNSDNAEVYNESYTEFQSMNTNLNENVQTDTYYMHQLWQFHKNYRTITNLFPWSASNVVCFVDANQTQTTSDGSSWSAAYQTIQECINDLNVNSPDNGGEVWVKQGTYTPTEVPAWKQNAGKTGRIHRSIIMYENIRLYGGFDGTETSRSARNFYQNPTYLSCDLGAAYCEQIVDAADNSLIDGFIFVKAQWTDGQSTRRRMSDTDSLSIGEILSSTAGNSGAGIYSNSTTISVVNSVFYKLFSSGKGGAIYCIGLQGYPSTLIKAPTILNAAFIGNQAAARGGAISADVYCNFHCSYCIFDSNACSKKGGAVYLDFDSDPTFTNSVFVNNIAFESGGCLAEDGKSNTTFNDNMVFINNTAHWEGGCLYSGSGVGPSIEQGFIFDTMSNENVVFSGNSLIHANKGQNDIYLWPYNILRFNDNTTTTTTTTPAPTTETTAQPTTSPTGNYSRFEGKPPNFLIFVIDDILYTEELNATSHGGAAGNHLWNDTVSYLDIPMPNIASFLNEGGIVFPRTYCGGPKCSPARFSILTGRHPSRSQFARHRTMQSSTGYLGTNVTIQTSKLLLNDSVYNIAYQLQNNAKQAYYTGMCGKWHLMSHNHDGYDVNCTLLDHRSHPEIYRNCTDIVKKQGFDFVDGYYNENIDDDATFGHNPEWITAVGQQFIDESLAAEKPFFLYMAHTLTHDPTAYESMFNFTVYDTPKKHKLSDSDLNLTGTGMHSREYLWQQAVDLGFSKENRLNFAAMDIWVDDAFGAMINYLKKKDLYDNTFIVVLNDHGMGAKGTLYEQGVRVWQFVRFPQLFGDNLRVLSSDVVVGTTDLASVIFDIANVTDVIDPHYVLDDSTNWIDDVLSDIRGDTNNSRECCQYRFIDMYNSHAIVTRDWKYIYRANDVVEPDGNVCIDYYLHCLDHQQLYYLPTDPNEQINLIGNASLTAVIHEMQTLMVEYIQNVACPVDKCIAPNITATDAPSSAPTAFVSTMEDTNYTSTGDENYSSTQQQSSVGTETTDDNDDDNGGDNGKSQNANKSTKVSIIVGVVAALICLVAIVVAGVVLRRRKHARKESKGSLQAKLLDGDHEL